MNFKGGGDFSCVGPTAINSNVSWENCDLVFRSLYALSTKHKKMYNYDHTAEECVFQMLIFPSVINQRNTAMDEWDWWEDVPQVGPTTEEFLWDELAN